MNEQEVVKLRNLFDSIVCLADEGPELHTKLNLMEAIIEEATKGYDICACHLTSRRSRAAEVCVHWKSCCHARPECPNLYSCYQPPPA